MSTEDLRRLSQSLRDGLAGTIRSEMGNSDGTQSYKSRDTYRPDKSGGKGKQGQKGAKGSKGNKGSKGKKGDSTSYASRNTASVQSGDTYGSRRSVDLTNDQTVGSRSTIVDWSSKPGYFRIGQGKRWFKSTEVTDLLISDFCYTEQEAAQMCLAVLMDVDEGATLCPCKHKAGHETHTSKCHTGPVAFANYARARLQRRS